ncbi:MAG: DNA-directed RNA polymerase subunit alpha [Candidatus Moranbacteria bacterium]|nr:DNA-directed RNA polymerase subunit alpha [Candidatus Moranbacteria bacterium]NTW46220.1 DNA-directed RNA polymerase subunit alpha [Candidatus Moranbacteria bacterium]
MIPVPQKPKVTQVGENVAKFEILGCYPGYGATLGNAIRRVLLSSLEGAAARSVKIKGVSHEFTSIPGVMEDAVQILLNLKQLRFRLHGDEEVTVSVKAKGEGQVKAGDLKASSSVEIVNPDQLIATLTDKKAEFEMELVIGKGIGYVPVESRESEEREIGTIALDAIYTPIRRVNYEVENMRVGKRTDYDKVSIEVVTDGSVTPEAAFGKAIEILVDQFSAIREEISEEPAEEPKKTSKKSAAKKAEEKAEEGGSEE